MSFIKPPDNVASGAGNIILNTSGIGDFSRIYCRIVGLDFDAFQATTTDFGKLLTLHLQQIGVRCGPSAIHGLVSQDPKDKSARLIGETVMQIIEKRTMAPRQISRKPGNAQRLVGHADWSSISTSDVERFAEAVRTRMEGMEPLMPQKQATLRGVEIFNHALGLHVPDDKVPVEGLYLLIRAISGMSDMDLGLVDRGSAPTTKVFEPPIGSISTEKAQNIITRLRKSPAMMEKISIGIKTFFEPKTKEIAGRTLSLTPVAFVKSTGGLGEWRCDFHLGEGTGSRYITTSNIIPKDVNFPAVFHRIKGNMFPVETGREHAIPERQFLAKLQNVLSIGVNR